MTRYTTDTTKRETKFFLKEYAGTHNQYDTERLHPMQHKLIIIDDINYEYKTYEISLGQLHTFLEYAELHPNMGSALDSVYKAIPSKEPA